jgi:putative ABC transport system permease protein
MQARPLGQAEADVTDARLQMYAMDTTTPVYQPEVIDGRWLSPGDTNAVVIHQRVAGEKDWSVGDALVLTDNSGKESEWMIVGIAYDPVANTALFAPIGALQRTLNATGLANALFIQTTATDAATQERVAGDLSAEFERRNFGVGPSGVFGEQTISALVAQTTNGFSLIIQLLAIMAVIIAVVGGVGLSGVLTLNVLERRREIGVMRSIGASNWRVIRLHIGEGILLGWLSWLIALPLSIPAAYFFATRGLSFALFTQLSYQFSMGGPLIWLVVITALAVIASLLPARSAAKVSVQQSLSYN